MHASEAINEILRYYLAPLMKSHGFRKRGQRFWRDTADVIDVLDLQKSQWNSGRHAEFTIEMGVYWPTIGVFSEIPPELVPPTSSRCTITERVGRLFGGGLDFWWEIRGVRDVPWLGEDLCEKVSRFALPWLESMHNVRDMVAYHRKHPCLFDSNALRRYLKANKGAESAVAPNRRRAGSLAGQQSRRRGGR